jgi:hypothetical protein
MEVNGQLSSVVVLTPGKENTLRLHYIDEVVNALYVDHQFSF